MLKEEDDRVTKRGKTRRWIKRRGEKGYFNKIVAAERLTVTLRFLATGESYRSLKVSSFVFREQRFHTIPYQFSGFQRLLCPFFFYLQRDRLYFLRKAIENFPYSPYCILTSTWNAQSKYKQRIIAMETNTRKVILAGMRVFNIVEHGGQTNATFLFTLRRKRNVG